ncbi:MAG TPA: hypothetical protein VJT73_09460 [Polyangiaceae bacterium]|nr:hypothetical protein [Polyangiaceae bacterium]
MQKLLALAAVFPLCVTLLGMGAGCKRPSPSLTTSPTPAPELRAAPPPVGLIAEIFVPHPDRSWEGVRATLDHSPFPASLALVLGGYLGLPVSTLDQLDTQIALVGAIVDDGSGPSPVLAVHVKDAGRLIDLMTTGTAPFRKGERTSSGVVALLSSSPGGSTLALAVCDNYLVFGPRQEALTLAAPFVAENLSLRPMPAEDFVAVAPQKALAGTISERLGKWWAAWKQEREAEDIALRQKHGGSAPDFGDPAQALADIDSRAGRFFSVVQDLAEARLSVVLEPAENQRSAAYRMEATIKARSLAGPAAAEIASMPIAAADPLLSLPSSSAVALLVRDTRELRDQSSAAQVEAIGKVLGGRLAESDKQQIEDAFRSWASGRGDWLTAGLLLGGSFRAAVVRGAVGDPKELSHGAASMLKLLGVRAIAEPLSNWVGDLKLSPVAPATPASEGALQSVHVTRRPPKLTLVRDQGRATDNDAFDIVWSVDKELIVGVAGRDARTLYATLQKPAAGKTIADRPFVKNSLLRLGATISFALVVDSSLLGVPHRADPDGSVFVLAYGKDPKAAADRAFIELDLPASALASYASLLGGLALAP